MAAKRRPAEPRLDPDEDSARFQVYEETISDGEAARLLRMPTPSFMAWRVRRGLPARLTWGEGTLSASEEARRKAAYKASSSDREAAEAVGMPLRAFTGWRVARGLPPLQARAPRLTVEEEERRTAAYEMATTDEEAAALAGLTPSAFKDWRRHRALPGRGRGGPQIDAAEEAHRYHAYESTNSDVDGAKKCGMKTSSFQRWRARLGLEAKTPPGTSLSPEEVTRRRAAYAANESDLEAARAVNISREAFGKWRRDMKLPSKRSLKRTR